MLKLSRETLFYMTGSQSLRNSYTSKDECTMLENVGCKSPVQRHRKTKKTKARVLQSESKGNGRSAPGAEHC